MSQILERPLAPARRRFDVGTYYKMAEAGVLGDARRVELIDGEIMDMAAIGSPHAAITNRLVRSLSPVAADGLALVSVQNPLRLDAYNEPQPDLTLLRPRADDYRASHPAAADVLLLAEVSETSLAYDRAVKFPLYARFGVAGSGSSISSAERSRFIASRRTGRMRGARFWRAGCSSRRSCPA